MEKEAFLQAAESGEGAEVPYNDDAVCSVCLNGDVENANAILFCDACNLPVHQECYGVPFVPEGQWLCRQCLQSPGVPVACCLCPNRGGALKQTTDGHWAHVVCAEWVPETQFGTAVFREPIVGVEDVPKERFRMACYICGLKHRGAVIQCQHAKCYAPFHVTCAQRVRLAMVAALDEASGRPIHLAYCDAHTPAGTHDLPFIASGPDGVTVVDVRNFWLFFLLLLLVLLFPPSPVG